ncbi:hypothetical protein Bpfe_021600 [Biomphalaria pfeifferi]|uniref:Uncharacterized protein n=1 Tax=Biomphalaria pfeifferi TaxID=112525 RepID=A0AAD8B6M9_BIOPF|nr:hypothetical protein Bpfe_021600 [Biomphalaria pfeifferi]
MIGILWEDCLKTVGRHGRRLWEDMREDCGKIVRRLWDHDWNIVERLFEDCGKTWEKIVGRHERRLWEDCEETMGP